MSHRGHLLCEYGAQSGKCEFGTNHRVDVQNHGPGEDRIVNIDRKNKRSRDWTIVPLNIYRLTKNQT